MTVEMVLAGVISFWSGFQMWSMLWDILGDIELPINNESVEEKKKWNRFNFPITKPSHSIILTGFRKRE